MTSPLAEPGSFRNRVVIVTGGAGSIGRPLCLALAAAGAHVIVNDYGVPVTGKGESSSTPAKALVEEIRDQDGSAIASNHNVATQAADIVTLALKTFGRIDVIINNAGIIRYKRVAESTITDFKEIMETNTMGAISLALAAWPHFTAQKYGRIINFTSDSTFGMATLSAYVTSKAALIGATRSMALEGAPLNIKINCVSPTSFSRMGGEDIENEAQKETFKNAYQGVGNIPMILALAHENIEVTGQTFSTAAFSVNHLVQGYKPGVPQLNTMEDCLKAQQKIMESGEGVINVPANVFDYMEAQATVKVNVDIDSKYVQ